MRLVQNKTQLRRITTKQEVLVELAVPGGTMPVPTTKRFVVEEMWEMARTHEWSIMFEHTSHEVFCIWSLRRGNRKCLASSLPRCNSERRQKWITRSHKRSSS